MNFLTEREAAERLHLSPTALARLRRQDQGPAWVRLGRRTLYTFEALNAWVAACTHDPAEPAAGRQEGGVDHA